MAILSTLLAVFYAEENWRGKRAWERCRRELEAKGEVLDWSAYIPAPIPDEENIIKAPEMGRWFIKNLATNWQDNALAARLSASKLSDFVQKLHPQCMAEVKLLPTRASNTLAAADLVLRHRYNLVSPVSAGCVDVPLSLTESNLSQVKIDDQPVSDALKILARLAGLNYQMEPGTTTRWDEKRRQYSEPNVTIRWENITAREGICMLLDAWTLRLIENPKTGIARIVKRKPEDPRVYVDLQVRELVRQMMESAWSLVTSNREVLSLEGSQGLRFVSELPPSTKPRQVTVLSDGQLSSKDIEAIFPGDLAGASPKAGSGWRTEQAGSNVFRLYRNPDAAYSAADYLAWSDQFATEFGLIREALKRPHIRMDDDYQQPWDIPIVNFVNIRNVAQLAGQRAQCCLLLGRSEQAFRELSFNFELRRLLASEPRTLVAAMIDVAVAGLDAGVIADGFRLQAWREPELVALQKQLRQIGLLGGLADSFHAGRAAACRTFETSSAQQIREMYSFRDSPLLRASVWEEYTNPRFLLFKFAPRGWVYQNLAVMAMAEQRAIDALDESRLIVTPGKLDAARRELEHEFSPRSPYNILATAAIPNLSGASRTAARNQTLVNQALIVCGLERHRLAHGSYPESLAALVPQFVEKLPPDVIGGQPLKYRRTDDGQFLLYSIGWNERDDGGTPGKEADTGDWVWTTKSQ